MSQHLGSTALPSLDGKHLASRALAESALAVHAAEAEVDRLVLHYTDDAAHPAVHRVHRAAAAFKFVCHEAGVNPDAVVVTYAATLPTLDQVDRLLARFDRRIIDRHQRAGRRDVGRKATGLERHLRPVEPSADRVSARPRGAGRPRAHAARSSARSGDSGDSDESEPPRAATDTPRRCKAPWCDHLVVGAAAKRYCGTERCTAARAAERQSKHRHDPDRDRLTDARVAHYIGDDAFARPDEHALSFLWRFNLVSGCDPGELDAILQYRTGMSTLAVA